jgi:hypothetical protein
MQKLLLLIWLCMQHSILGATGVGSYWQEYGSASTVAFYTENNTLSELQTEIDLAKQPLTIIVPFTDNLLLSTIREFYQTTFKLVASDLKLQSAHISDFERITQPVGIARAKEYNHAVIASILAQAVSCAIATHCHYVVLTDFLELIDNQPVVYQLLSIKADSQIYDKVSLGIAIDSKFYQQYVRLPNNLHQQAYTMRYALQKAYYNDIAHWQLPVTNYKITKVSQLKN